MLPSYSDLAHLLSLCSSCIGQSHLNEQCVWEFVSPLWKAFHCNSTRPSAASCMLSASSLCNSPQNVPSKRGVKREMTLQVFLILSESVSTCRRFLRVFSSLWILCTIFSIRMPFSRKRERNWSCLHRAAQDCPILEIDSVMSLWILG